MGNYEGWEDPWMRQRQMHKHIGVTQMGGRRGSVAGSKWWAQEGMGGPGHILPRVPENLESAPLYEQMYLVNYPALLVFIKTCFIFGTPFSSLHHPREIITTVSLHPPQTLYYRLSRC